MIAYLEGEIKGFLAGRAVILVGGVGYEVWWVGSDLSVGDEVVAWVYTHMTDRSTTLFGFEDDASRLAFLGLLKVNGVGPKSAYAIVRNIGTDGVRNAISEGNVEEISSAPGIGPKLARRIISEMKDSLDWEETESILPEAQSALEELGYKKSDAKMVLGEMKKNSKEDLKSAKLEDVIRDAIKMLR